MFYRNGWDLKLKSSTSHEERAVWKDEEQFEVHNNDVSFQVDCLLTYVVVGVVSLHSTKSTKKRLQCAVFGGEGRVGVNYTAYLYVFDDSEASLEVLNLLDY